MAPAAQGAFDVTGFEDVSRFLGVMRRHAGQEVGLELEPDRKLGGIGFAHAALLRVHLVADAQQVLHVVADLVRHHIGLSKFARRFEAVLQLVKEAKVNINFLIGRAIKRADCRACEPATFCADVVGEEHERRLHVLAVHLFEDVVPHVFGFGQYDRNEIFLFFFRRVPGRTGLRRGGRLVLLQQVEHLPGISPQESGHQHDDECQKAPADGDSRGNPSSVLDVLAPTFVFPAHGDSREVSFGADLR